MTGFLRGLKIADPDRRIRTITICERERARFEAIARSLHRLCATKTFDDVEVVLRFRELPAPLSAAAATARGMASASADHQPVYLMVRRESGPGRVDSYVSSLLTPGTQAAIIKARNDEKKLEEFKVATVEAYLARLDDIGDMDVDKYGDILAQIVLDKSILEALTRYNERPLVVVHDSGASRVPWELVKVGGKFPALAGGISHRFEADGLAIARWSTQKPVGDTLSVLLVTNPNRSDREYNLPNAEAEGSRISEKCEKLGAAVRLTHLSGDAARRSELLRHFQSGDFDVVHYAGHAFFDPDDLGRSGILCAGREVLSGADLTTAARLPSLAFQLHKGSRRPDFRGLCSCRRISPRTEHFSWQENPNHAPCAPNRG